jgi:hypothetical protein
MAFSDRGLKALEPAPKGDRREIYDMKTPGLGVRVYDDKDPLRPGKAARIMFILYARYSSGPARRVLGRYRDTFGLADARVKAAEWQKLIDAGKDPAEVEKQEKEQQERAKQLANKRTFVAIAEDFIEQKTNKERKGAEIERDIRREFIPAFGGKPMAEVTDLDILAVINAKKAKAPAQARNLLGTAKRLWNWAIDQRTYGLSTSPCDRLKPTAIIGKKKKRDRKLTDDELFALWRAAKRMPYPYGPFYQLLPLTALRLNALADAPWSEFHPELRRVLRLYDEADCKQPINGSKVALEHRTWIVPKERMKGEDGDARDHAVALPPVALEIITALPRFKRGGFLFSTDGGENPVWISDKIKKQLDARMLRTLKALARTRGEDPSTVELKPWVNHDLRRNVRSGLSALRIEERVREAVLAHVPKGITGVYDVYDYLTEKAEALELWAARLRSIVERLPPATDNVIPLLTRA